MVCTIGFLAVTARPQVSAIAASKSDMQSQINELEKKSSKIEEKIKKLKKDKSQQNVLKSALQSKIDNIQAQINVCNAKINSYQSQINAGQAKIDQKRIEMEDNIRLFKERIRIIYMTGSGQSDVNVILGADNFSEYLTLSALTGKVSARDKKLMEDIKDSISEIEAEQAVVKQYMAAQNDAKSVLAQKRAVLDADMAEYNGVINSINSEQSKLEKENAQYEKAIKNLERSIQNLSRQAANSNVVYSGEKFTWPVPGYYNVYSPYGTRNGRLHAGIDISSSGINGKTVVAAASGVVIAAGWNSGGYGNYIMINHGSSGGNTYVTLYGHLSSVGTSVGATVSRGQAIGRVGSTGRSSGPHLHFEIRVNGSARNPMGYFGSVK